MAFSSSALKTPLVVRPRPVSAAVRYQESVRRRSAIPKPPFAVLPSPRGSRPAPWRSTSCEAHTARLWESWPVARALAFSDDSRDDFGHGSRYEALDHVRHHAATTREDPGDVGIARGRTAENQAGDSARGVRAILDHRAGHVSDEVHAAGALNAYRARIRFLSASLRYRADRWMRNFRSVRGDRRAACRHSCLLQAPSINSENFVARRQIGR